MSETKTKRDEILATIARHPFRGMGDRTIYEAPGALANEFLKMLAEAWDEGAAGGLSWNENLGEDFKTPNPYR